MRRLTLTLVAAVCALLPAVSQAATGLPGREADPIVITGEEVPSLRIPPEELVAFRFDEGWRQIPVQVDERAVVDYRAVRQTTGFRPFSHLAYADAGTFAGPDPNPVLDADDEIAAMALDSGESAAGRRDPAGVVAGTRADLEITDPLQPGTTRHIYLFRSAGSLEPSAGRRYVDYDFSLDSGDYKTTYDFDGVADNGSGPPANTENSVVDTNYYRQRLLSRWVSDQLAIRAGTATGVDILDGDKAQVAYGCGRSEVTFSRGGGGFIANRSGPVRAIRSYIGANSGTYTQRDEVFYERSSTTTTFLRVHAGITTISQFLDYSPAASGMRYRNSTVPDGAIVDGAPDRGLETDAMLGPPFTWEQVTGPQGTLSIVNRMVTNMPGVTIGSYYEDDTAPAAQQCNRYADSQAWGASGPAVTGTGQNSDPTLGPAYDFEGTRTIFFSAPGGDAALAARRADQVDQPLAVDVKSGGAKGRARIDVKAAGRYRVEAGKRHRLWAKVRNRDDFSAGRVELCIRAPRELVRATRRCAVIERLGPGKRRTVRAPLRLTRAAADRDSIRARFVAKGPGVQRAIERFRIKPR